MAKANLEKDEWFLEQFEKGRISFNGEFFFNPATGNVFKSVNSCGYIVINLQVPETRKILGIGHHRLIWIITHGLIEDSTLVINHLDGNKRNNSISNLELVTPGRNLQHAIDAGLIFIPKAEEKINAVFTNEQVRKFREDFANGMETVASISEKCKCHKNTVRLMLKRLTYQELN